MGETEVKGLRRQKLGFGGNAAWPGPLPQQLSATSSHTGQPLLGHCRRSYLPNNKDIWERAGWEACPALPAEPSSCFAGHRGPAPVGEGRRNPQSSAVVQPPLVPLLLLVIFVERRPRIFGRKEEWVQQGSYRWETGISSAICFDREDSWSRASDGGQDNL